MTTYYLHQTEHMANRETTFTNNFLKSLSHNSLQFCDAVP